MALDFSKFGTPVEQSSALDFSKFGTPAQPPEKQSAFRQIADVPLGIAKGAVQGVRMIADAFGAGSDTSKTIKSAETYLADLMSAQAKNDQQEISRIMKDAEDKGVLDQVKAGIKAFTVAPVDTLSSALGTAAPVIAGALGAKILGAGALVTTGVSALTGAGMGAGTIKGSIYEETKKTLKEAGASEQDAEARAKLAQEYGGKNLDQILLGTVLGGAAAVGPLEKGGAAILARRILGKTGTEATETVAGQAAKGAVRRRLEAGALEAVPEAVQAGQEQVAQNIALQREGFDVPTFRGAVSSATLEALAGAGLGAAVGGGKPAAAPEVPPPEAPPAPPPPALEYKPEPFIQFPDGTVAKRSEVEAYIKTLPEDQQMAMRAKLLGLAPQEAAAPPAEPIKALEFKPTPLIVYPDGSVARSGEVDAYIQSLPEDEQIAARAKLLGMGEVATRVTPEMLRKLGIRGRAPVIQRLSGLELTDPKVTEELTNFAAQPYASPEVRGNIFGFLNTIKPVAPPVEPAAEVPAAPVAEAAAAPVPPPVAPAPPPVAAVKPSVAEDSELVTPAPVVEAAAPVVEEKPAREPSTRKEAEAFGKAIGAAQPYPGELRGRVNLPAQKAAKEGNFQGVLSALEKSKNVIVAEIAKRAKSLGTKIVIDDNAEETYTGPSELMRQMSIDGAKMHLEALNKIRALAPQIDSLPDGFRLGYDITGEKINAIDQGKDAGRMSLGEIADMGHSMFAPLATGPFKLKTKEDFKRLQKAYEDLTSEYGENALQLTSTGSAEMRGVAGAYDADTDTIRVPEYTAKREEVLSHEIVHAQTVQSIANPTLRQKPIVARLNKLYEHVKKELEGRPGRAPYGIQSIQEFVAEGMGNPAFQFLLKKIKYENTSAWDSFVQTIANLIGVKRDTAFTELLSIYSDLTTEQKAPAAPTVEAATPKAEAPTAELTKLTAQIGGSDTTLDLGKPVWQATDEDLVQAVKDSGAYLGKPGSKYDPYMAWREAHNKAIQQAKREGKPFPAEVLYDKPSLIRDDLSDNQADEAIDAMVDMYRATKDYGRAVEAYRNFGKKPAAKAPAAPTVEAAAPKAEAPPTLDTTGITPVKGRHPQVQAAAKLLQDKKISREEFEKYVDYYKPIQEVESEKLLPPTSEQRMNETVNADKRDRINVPVADGTKVGLRMDLPARERGGSVVSIHEGKSGKMTVGKLMGFRSTGWLKDVTFEVRSQEKGLAVAAGASKAPQQTVEGTWFNLSPEETYARVKELMKDPAWKQIGFDPSRHGYFYDRKTTQPVVSASEMYQVGQFLLAKDVKYAPKSDFLYSLGGERAQVQAFEQTLRNLLNKFGLKDVGLKILDGMTDSGSYAAQLIRIAADAANPVRTLRHEAIHALRELGFFTDAQWKSLSKMAKDKWIDQYLKQRNVDGKPLKAGEESRYDAYMREYNGDMEKITEEAVSDAFADFDATKPPAGLIQALLKRMKDLFQSIKSALTKVESPEQIFGKVEKGELKEGAREAKGEAKSLRDRATANFKRWFGDSKVVDEKGEPLVVYHGTARDFSVFGGSENIAETMGGTEKAFFFTSTPGRAEDFAAMAGDGYDEATDTRKGGENIMPVYLSLKNPLVVNRLIEDVGEIFDLIEQAQTEGRDGVILPRTYDYSMYHSGAYNEEVPVYVAFKPTQIKSAIGNNGDYSLTNADIRKSLAGKRSTQEIARIFGQMVKRAENEMTSVLFNWNDSQLNEDKDKIIMYPGRDQRFVRGKEGGKSNVSKAEFIDWLMSGGPFDTSVYGEEITSDEKWRNEIETLRGIVERPDIRKSIGGIKAAAQKALQNQPMPEKGLGHVKQDLKNLAQPIFFAQNKTILDRIDGMKDRFWQRVAQNTADQFRTIKEYSPLGYMQARLSKSVDGGLEGLLFHGQVFDDGGALNIKAKTKGMMDILKPLGNELDSYLMWVALNRESLLPDKKRSKIPNMDQLVARRDEFSAGELNGKPRAEVYRDVLRQMNQLNKSVLDIALAKGLIDQKGYDKFSGDIYYVPFYKKMEEDGTIAGAQTASGLTSQDFSKELKGSDKPFGDLMENVVRNWSHILSASMKNAAAKTTLDDAVELGAAVPNLKTGLEWKDGKVYSIKSGKPIEAKVDEDGKEYAEGELRPDLTKQDAGMAKIMVDGQPMYFKVTDDLLMDSISSIGYLGPKSKFILLMRDFKNMLQYGVTASPIFKVNNLIRDSVAAMAVSDLKKNPVANVLKGISLSDKDSPTYISALAGGAIFNFGSAYEGDQAKLIKRLLDQGVPGDSILDTKEKITKGLKTAWDAYQNLGDKSEAANRLSLYQQMRDKGMTHLQASFMARDLLDFSMQGSWPAFRFFTQVVPFMNARIQGLYKLGRDGIIPTTRVLYNATTGKEIDANDKIRAAQFATITTAVMLASALLYLSFKDDEDFKKRDAWDRDNFWWIKLPGMDVALRVPKPFEVGAFGTLVERTLEQILDQGAEGKQFGESLSRTLWDTFSLNPTPQMFKPLIDIYANKDSFSGAPIESAGLERLSKQERATDQTSPLAIALGGVTSLFPEKFQLSPVQMDYMLKGYFGWLGAMASVTSTYAVMPFKEGEYPDARWLDRASLGLARELPAPQSAYVTQFYNASKEISQAYADMRHYREMGDAEKVQEILEEKGDKIALAKFYDKTAKNIANVRKQIRLITNDKDMDGAEKKEAIERMKLIMSDLAKQAEEVRKSMKQ